MRSLFGRFGGKNVSTSLWVGWGMLFCGLFVWACNEDFATKKRSTTRKRRAVTGESSQAAIGGTKQNVEEPKNLMGEKLWQGGRFEESVARLRVSEVLTAQDRAQWAVFDVKSGRTIHKGDSNGWDRPSAFSLGGLGAIVCGYTAMRTGHLKIGEFLECRGDPGVPQGHGRVNVVEALRKGCRSFFQRTAARLSFEEFRIGARLMGVERGLPKRPEGFFGRLELFADGKGFSVTLKELGRMGLRLARGDPGDPALKAVRLGLLKAVRNGVAQRAGIAGVGVAGTIGFRDPKTKESTVLLWTPFKKARFVIVTRSLPQTDPLALARRILGVLIPAKAPRIRDSKQKDSDLKKNKKEPRISQG